jgi:hypothetical protein
LQKFLAIQKIFVYTLRIFAGFLAGFWGVFAGFLAIFTEGFWRVFGCN